MREYIVDFGDKSSAFVGLAMAEAVSHGANIQCEVVRCRECKKWHYFDNDGERFGDCDEFKSVTRESGFCAWGERA